jgi:dual specificity phosphatase 12
VFGRGFRYLHLELTDPDPAFADHIDTICRFIRVGRKRGAVLVHCRMGLSRSPAAILAYLCGRGRTLEQGLRLLRKGVGEREEFTEPHEAFLEQLRDYYELEKETE